MRRRRSGGVSKREEEREREREREREELIESEREKERKNMHMNPEGLMCLHYLGCDLSPTSSTSIMHHIHKRATDLGAPATHSYYFNWIKSVQISRARLPHCGFSILVVIWFVRCITLPSRRHCRSASYMPQEALSSMGFRWLPYGTYSTFKTNTLLSCRSGSKK